MKTLKEYISESIINESDPRADFKVKKDLPTDFMWEYYEGEVEELIDEIGFEQFLEYAKKNRWKQDKKGYYIIPKGTKLTFYGHMSSASWIGMWEINDDGVYISMTYDEVKYGDYDDYLKEI